MIDGDYAAEVLYVLRCLLGLTSRAVRKVAGLGEAVGGSEKVIVDLLDSAAVGERGMQIANAAARLKEEGWSQLLETARGELEDLADRGISALWAFTPTEHHAAFPEMLLGDESLLFTMGSVAAWDGPLLAVAGSRHPSEEMEGLVSDLVGEAEEAGLGIVTGMASGVDAAAASAAYERESPLVGVPAEGLASYQRSNRQACAVFAEAAHPMALLSAFCPNQPWASWAAMDRNGLVLRLSQALVVVEARMEGRSGRSGTMEAAREAVKLGLPCLVMSPELFEDPPDGNVSLLAEGNAVELRPGELAEALAAQPMGPQLGLGLDDDD